MISSINENLPLRKYIINFSSIGENFRVRQGFNTIINSSKRFDYNLLLELPIYRMRDIDYRSRDSSRRKLLSNSYNIEYTKYSLYKTFGNPFMGVFKNGGSVLYKISAKNHPDIFVAKGIITTENFHPLILVTTKLDPSNMLDGMYCVNSTFDFNTITIYLNRCIFTDSFHTRYRGLSNVIRNKILPELMIIPAKIEVKDNLNIWSTIDINPNTTPEEYKRLLIEETKVIEW